jgi:hypothetical protein
LPRGKIIEETTDLLTSLQAQRGSDVQSGNARICAQKQDRSFFHADGNLARSIGSKEQRALTTNRECLLEEIISQIVRIPHVRLLIVLGDHNCPVICLKLDKAHVG